MFQNFDVSKWRSPNEMSSNYIYLVLDIILLPKNVILISIITINHFVKNNVK